MKTKIRVVAVALSALALAACNGVGEEDSSHPAPVSSAAAPASVSSAGASTSTSSGTPASSEPSPSSSEPSSPEVSEVTITLIHYSGETEIKTIQKGMVFADPGEDGADVADTRWDGWFNGDVLYDFTQVVNDNLTLTAKRTRYEDIPVQLKVEAYEDWQEADGELMRGNVVGYQGHYMEQITLSQLHALFSSTLRYDISAYNLYDGDGNLVQENVKAGDTITLTKEGTMTLKPTATTKKATVTFAKEDGGGNAITVADGAFEDATIDLNGDYTVPSDAVTPADGYVFLGWYREEDDTIKEIFRPGERIPNSLLVACNSTIHFIPYLRSSDEVKDIATPDDLVAVENKSTEVLNLTADLDFHAEDGSNGTALIAGIGAGDFEGIILGNGHTISGYTVGDAANSVSAGLIDSASGDSIQVFDLNLDDVEVTTTNMTGASPLIGEADAPVILKNINISNVTYGTDVDTGTKPAVGGAVGYNWGYDLVLENVKVDNMDTTHAIVHDESGTNVDGYASSTTDKNKFAQVGGLIGHEDDDTYGTRIVGCTVSNATLATSSYDATAYVGGIIGDADGFSGVLEGNTISNTTINVNGLSGEDCKVGGVIGYWNNESGRYSYANSSRSSLPVSIAKNHIDVDASIADSAATSTMDLFAGGIAGDMRMDGNGNGSNKNTCFTATADNVVNFDLATTFQGTPRIFAGGFYGNVGMDSSDYRNFVLSNNELHVNLDADATGATGSYVGGVIGMFDSAGSSGMIVDGLTIDGMVTGNSTDGTSLNLAGLAAHVETETGGVDVDHVFLNETFPEGANFGTLYGYASTNASSEGESTGLNHDHIYAGSQASVGAADAKVVTPVVLTVSATNGALAQTGFSSYYWKDDETGHLALK